MRILDVMDVLKENVVQKRPRGSPTGNTPRLVEKRPAAAKVKARRRLPFVSPTDGAWTAAENSSLVEFILLYKPSTSWPADKDESFWNAAASFVQMRSESGLLRTG